MSHLESDMKVMSENIFLVVLMRDWMYQCLTILFCMKEAVFGTLSSQQLLKTLKLNPGIVMVSTQKMMFVHTFIVLRHVTHITYILCILKRNGSHQPEQVGVLVKKHCKNGLIKHTQDVC